MSCPGHSSSSVVLSRQNSPPARQIHSRSASILIPHRSSLTVQQTGDEADAIDYTKMEFTLLDAAAIIFSICSFTFDIGTDVIVSCFHYKNRDYWYMGLTLGFVIIPTLAMTIISLRWYVLDAREKSSPPVSTCTWITRVVFLLLQLGPILRYVDSLTYGLKSRKYKDKKDQQRKFFTYMTYEDTDAAFLRLFECYMEAAPQLVLQLYIFAKKNPEIIPIPPFSSPSTLANRPDRSIWTDLAQVSAITCSLISVAWSLVSYNRALRTSLRNKKNLTWQGTIFQFLWRFFVIASRVLALALFASVYRFYIGFVVAAHWLLMFIWIRSMKTKFCDNECEERGYNAVLACMFIFAYFNPIDSPTRFRYFFYYCFMLCENSILMYLWFTHPDTLLADGTEVWYRQPALYGHYISLFIGLNFMFIYYVFFHPTGNIQICRTTPTGSDHTSQDYCQQCEDAEREKLQLSKSSSSGKKNGLWTTQGRIFHPRPTVPPESTSSLHFNVFRDSKKRRSRKCHHVTNHATNGATNGGDIPLSDLEQACAAQAAAQDTVVCLPNIKDEPINEV